MRHSAKDQYHLELLQPLKRQTLLSLFVFFGKRYHGIELNFGNAVGIMTEGKVMSVKLQSLEVLPMALRIRWIF